MIMMTPDVSQENQRFALQITLEENGEVFSAPQVVVPPGKSYTIDFAAGAEYDMAIDIPSARLEVGDPFARDLEPEGQFL